MSILKVQELQRKQFMNSCKAISGLFSLDISTQNYILLQGANRWGLANKVSAETFRAWSITCVSLLLQKGLTSWEFSLLKSYITRLRKNSACQAESSNIQAQTRTLKVMYKSVTTFLNSSSVRSNCSCRNLRATNSDADIAFVFFENF